MQYKSAIKITKNSYFDLLIRIVGLILIFQVSRVLFYTLNKNFFSDISSEEFIKILKGGFLFDLVSIIYLNLLWILIYILPFPNSLKNKLRKFSNLFFFFINAVGLLFNAVDSVYYQFNLKRTTYSSLFEISDLPNFWTLLPSFIVRYWPAWASWLMILLPLWYLLKITNKPKFTNTFHTQIDFFIILLFPILAGVRGGNLRHSTRPIGINHAAFYIKTQSNTALVLNTPFTIFKTLGNKSLSRLSYFKDNVSLNQEYNPVTNFTNTKKKNIEKYNIVILIIESYSEEASGLNNKDLRSGGFTPFLDSLRLQSFYSGSSFANGKKSIEALPSLLCGIPSLKIPFVLSEYSNNTLNSLPLELRNYGYSSSFFHGAANGSMGFQAFCNSIGIENYYGKDEYNNNEDHDDIWGIWDEPFLQFTAKKIKLQKQPFISTIFTLSSHDPFKIPAKYNNKFRKGQHPIYQTLAYTDVSVKKFFESIKHEAWFQNTIFVISGDHTSSHASVPEFSNSVGRFRVPIFFYCPKLLKPEKSEKNIQQTDVFASVLGLIGHDKPILTFGKNIFDNSSKNHAVNYFNDYQWFNEKYVLIQKTNKTSSLYNFEDDKLLKKDLSANLPTLKTKMKKELQAFTQHYNNRMIDNQLIIK